MPVVTACSSPEQRITPDGLITLNCNTEAVFSSSVRNKSVILTWRDARFCAGNTRQGKSPKSSIRYQYLVCPSVNEQP